MHDDTALMQAAADKLLELSERVVALEALLDAAVHQLIDPVGAPVDLNVGAGRRPIADLFDARAERVTGLDLEGVTRRQQDLAVQEAGFCCRYGLIDYPGNCTIHNAYPWIGPSK